MIERRFFLRRSKGILNVSSSPQGAEIYLDGRYVGVTPKVLRDLERQKKEIFILLRKDGYKEKKATLDWGKKIKLDYEARLAPYR